MIGLFAFKFGHNERLNIFLPEEMLKYISDENIDEQHSDMSKCTQNRAARP